MAASPHVEMEIAGRAVRISNPDKVFFPKRGETKLDLIEYYLSVAEPVMAALGGRPTLLQRFPDGASGKNFFQKRVPKGAPEWLQQTTVETVNGTPSNALVLADMAHVAWAVNMGCLGFHPWPFHANDASHADELRIDLDPQPGLTFDHVRRAAQHTKDYLDELGLAAGVKTTGSRGVHIHLRLERRYDSYQVRAAAVSIARELEIRHPELLTAAWWKEERGDRVFVDFNQNAPHKTVFGAWSARPRVAGQVSAPIAWSELADVAPDDLTIDTVPRIVADRGDPWADLDDVPQNIDSLLERFDIDLDAGLGDAPWPPVYPKQPDEPPRVAPSRARAPD